MNFGIKGKVAVITGGDSGMGKATAKLLAAEGVKIALIDRTKDDLNTTATEIGEITEAMQVTADLTDLDQVEAAKQQILKHYGAVHILVNCAGITGSTKEFLELTDEDWYETIDVDFMSAVRVCRAFIPSMQQEGWGRIVLIGSEDAVQPYTDEMPYCAAKAGVLNLTKNLSAVIAFLCSQHSSFVVGANYRVAGDPEVRADSDLGSEIRSKLEANIPRSQLTVEASDGKAKILGTVPSQEEYDKIMSLAKEIKGVNEVTMEVKVVPATES
jgi:NADP-dependent 3-hydroxy acid dehydrogenase YdfG